jgi:hypothetical protein
MGVSGGGNGQAVIAGQGTEVRGNGRRRPVACSPMPPSTTTEALAILELRGGGGASPVVAGEWGVDALIGRQTREHADLDVAIDGTREAAAVAAQHGATP